MPQDPQAIIRTLCRRYPEAEQATVLGDHKVFRVRKKVFVWLGDGEKGGTYLGVKLKESQSAAMTLPFVMPIMHAARALAKTLTDSPTPVSYPAMPVVVKTPAIPTVVAPPLPGIQGEWRVELVEDGIKALFTDATGTLAGFALTGSAVAEKNALAQKIPPWLPS